MNFKKAELGRPTAPHHHLPLFTMSGDNPDIADDHAEERLDIAQLLIVRPDDTFFVRVEGETMDDVSIGVGDLLVVDRSIEPRHNDTVIAIVHGEFTVKLLHSKPVLHLVSRNKDGLTEIDEPFEIWGVVLWVIHKARGL